MGTQEKFNNDNTIFFSKFLPASRQSNISKDKYFYWYICTHKLKYHIVGHNFVQLLLIKILSQLFKK